MTAAYVDCALESACACSQQPHRPYADQVAVVSSLVRWYLPIQISSLKRLRLKNPNDVKMAKAATAATIYRHPPLRVSEPEHSPWPWESTSMSSVGYCSWSSANSISISDGESLAQRENSAYLRNPSHLQEFLPELEEGTSAEIDSAEHENMLIMRLAERQNISLLRTSPCGWTRACSCIGRPAWLEIFDESRRFVWGTISKPRGLLFVCSFLGISGLQDLAIKTACYYRAFEGFGFVLKTTAVDHCSFFAPNRDYSTRVC